MRVRQVVIAAAELEPTVARLREALPLGEPYHDPGVGEFGLRNAVMALGDAFVEVVSPVRPDTAAGRHIERRGGDAGYMVIVQVDDLAAQRRRAAVLGVRTVWQADLPDISASHLHPRDTGGTLLSLDEARPPASWRWGGPQGAAPGAGAALSVSIAVPDPAAVAARWGALLDRPVHDAGIGLDLGRVRFTSGDAGLCAVEATLAGSAPDADVEVAGVGFSVRSGDPDGVAAAAHDVPAP